jgi:hypothetical protein
MKIKLLVLAIFLFPIALSAQDIPSNVKQKATELYPNATNVKWDVEGKGQYEASLTDNGIDMSLLFDDNANLLATETKMNVDQLPRNVRDYVAANYSGMDITEAAKIVDSKGVTTYEAEVYDGKKHKDVLFDKNGNPLKKSDKDDDEEDEEDGD